MTVRAAPIWVIKPYDRYSISGTSVRFECQTFGYPQPVIRWKFIKTNTALQTVGSEAVSILSSPQIHVLENGSLSIRSVEEKFQGFYICDASNGVGRPLETSAKLFVHSVPQLRVQQKQIIIRKLAQTQFSCTAIGSPPLTLQWLKNGYLLNSIDRYIVREEVKLQEKVSIIIINQVMRNDTGIFTCLAINLFGSESLDINVIIQEAPDPPSNLHTLEIGSRTVALAWSLTYFGNSVIIKHNVEYKKKTGISLFYS
jgi:Down syndrome cell adhesion protein